MKEKKIALLLAVVEQNRIVGFSVVKFFERLDPSGPDPNSCTIGVAVHPDCRKLASYSLPTIIRDLADRVEDAIGDKPLAPYYCSD